MLSRRGLRQALGLASFLMMAAGSAFAATPTPISSCPTTISAAGFYQVQTPLTAIGTCITIDTPNVTLSLAANITGDLTGTGILIASGASGTVIRGNGGAQVKFFNIGVEDEPAAV